MKQVKITALKQAVHQDLIEKYENPLANPCEIKVGQVFISNGKDMPQGFCSSAWQNLAPYVFALSSGATNIYDDWMKDKTTAMISCNDGFRPMSFLLETLNENQD